MNLQAINTLKGLHPGIFLERELKKRNLAKGRLAISIDEYPQTLGAITKGKRDMNPGLAMKLENALNLEEGFLMILQVYYDYKKIKQSQQPQTHPDITKFRKSTFWDTRLESINWQDQKKAIIKRVFERGNDAEKAEIKRFYGEQLVDEILSDSKKDAGC
jgi:plasmid maintenance system antidote protein VapI